MILDEEDHDTKKKQTSDIPMRKFFSSVTNSSMRFCEIRCRKLRY